MVDSDNYSSGNRVLLPEEIFLVKSKLAHVDVTQSSFPL